VNAEEQLPGEDFASVTQDSEKSPIVQFSAAAVVPTYDVVFSISPDPHSSSEGRPTILEYDRMSVGSVNSIRRPAPARMPSDASLYAPQGLKRLAPMAAATIGQSPTTIVPSLARGRTPSWKPPRHHGGRSAPEQHLEHQTQMGDRISEARTVVE